MNIHSSINMNDEEEAEAKEAEANICLLPSKTIRHSEALQIANIKGIQWTLAPSVTFASPPSIANTASASGGHFTSQLPRLTSRPIAGLRLLYVMLMILGHFFSAGSR